MTAPHFFIAEEFRRWLEAHHATDTEVWVGFYKKGTGRPTMTWSESVDEALCYGWIDGVRKSLDAERYVIRFSPRKAVSIWSNVNIAKVGRLIEAGRMRPAGMAAWARRDETKSGIYSFERMAATLNDAQTAQFRKNRRAWSFFEKQPPYYKRVAAHYVSSAKREETRARRLAILISHSAKGERLPGISPAKPPAKPR
jgi:uncharacterized protein YdeI (YjbR/CyaY-like superfamily)